MRIAVISTQNTLLSGAISKYLRERGELMPERVSDPGEVFSTAAALNASVVLMEATRASGYSLAERLGVAQQLRERGLGCRTALLCDDNADPELGERIAQAKKDGLIDNFFYSSVSGEYLAAALEAM